MKDEDILIDSLLEYNGQFEDKVEYIKQISKDVPMMVTYEEFYNIVMDQLKID